ncbi:hypothetical protein MY4824_007005 [Beauveria thailandica]
MYKYSAIASPFEKHPPRGGVNWIEIPAADLAVSQEFYQKLFPLWKFENPAQNPLEFMRLFKVEEPDYMEGSIIKVNDYTKTYTNGSEVRSSGIVPYFLVESLDEAQKQVTALGGSVVLEKQDGRGDGWYGKYLDPDGNVFCLWEVRVKE